MLPTAARLATVRPLTASNMHNPLKRVAANFAGWSVAFTLFMGWPLGVIAYENTFHGPDSSKR